MIRILRLVLLGLLAISLLTVALGNRAAVTVHALPENVAALTRFSWQIDLPLFLVIFISIIAGVLIGFVWEWFREHRIRATANANSRQVARLERELAVMRDTKPGQKDDVLALLDQSKAK